MSALSSPPHNPSHSLSSRQRPKQVYSMGIAAGAEDVKYQAKYKELNRKVKEIEADNDKLHYKVLEAKRSIRRLRLERAILYERLSAVPVPPADNRANPHPSNAGAGPNNNIPPLPPHEPSSYRLEREYGQQDVERASLEPSERMYTNRASRSSAKDGRHGPTLDTHGPPSPPPHHALPPVHQPVGRSSSSKNGNYESSRQLAPLPSLPPVHLLDAPAPSRNSAQHGHRHSHSHQQQSPPMHHRNSGGHEHLHSTSRSRHSSGTPHFADNLPPVQTVMHSPPLQERDRERSRHHEHHDHPSAHDPHYREREQHSVPPSPMAVSSRGAHNHQRIGPGTYINRDYHDRDLDRDWQRNADISSSRSPSIHSNSRPRQPPHERAEYSERHGSRMRDEPGYYSSETQQRSGGPIHDNYPAQQRPDSPGSNGQFAHGEGPPGQQPDSRGQYFDHHRSSFRLRPVNPPNEEIDFVHEDGRSQSRDRGRGFPSEQSRSSYESMRKRPRNDLELDSEHEGSGGGGGGHGGSFFAGGHLPDDRGSKRFHHSGSYRGRDVEE